MCVQVQEVKKVTEVKGIHNAKKRRKRVNCIALSLLLLLACLSVPLSLSLSAAAQTEFESYLRDQGFPESYWDGLETLHTLHPQWIFKAQKVNLNWDDVVAAESVVGRNLVAKSSINSWKSFEYGAYNFTTHDWVGFDGASWIAASKEIIAYYLDPRNFINDSTAFMFLNQSFDASTQTVDGIKKMVAGTFLDNAFPEGGYATYSDVILAAAQQSNVNPYVLASSIIQEQGVNGSSGSISGTYPGYESTYNYFNVGAYASGDMSAVERGLWWAQGAGGSTTYNRPWNTRAKAIVGGSVYYGSNYVNVGQNTLYYKKFNVVNKSAGYYYHQYMTNIQGAESEAKTLKKAYANVMDTPLIFNVPVYGNMPGTAAAKPTSTGNNNNLLSSLSVDGYALTPTFTMYTTNYDLIVDKDTYSIHINAATSDANAAVVSSSTASLADGDNIVDVNVRASSGVVRTYELDVYKQPNPNATTTTPAPTTSTTTKTAGTTTTTTTHPTEPPKPSISSSSYTIDSIVSNVKPDTPVGDFLGNIAASNAALQVVDSSGNAKSGNIATGDQLRVLQNGSVYATYAVSVNGDINGDGKLSGYDLLKIQRHILDFEALSGISLDSADYNKDGKISGFDLLMIEKYILNL